jgi:Arc/MetJ family transcription regulator
MGRTNLVLDDELIEQAMAVTGARTKREVVDIALRSLIGQRELYHALVALRGKLQWIGNIDDWRRSRS